MEDPCQWKNGAHFFRDTGIKIFSYPANPFNHDDLRSISFTCFSRQTLCQTPYSSVVKKITAHNCKPIKALVNFMRYIFLLIVFYYANAVMAQQPLAKLAKVVTKLGNDAVKCTAGAGLSVAVYHDGQTWYYNFGTVEKGVVKRPTENTVFEIGSITKTFVSLLLAQAVVDGKVTLQDDVRKYLTGDYPNLEYDHHPITLLNLANTTSGLPDVLPSAPDSITKNVPADSVSFVVERYYQSLTETDFYKLLHTVKLDTLPGYNPKHSNCAAQLLGYIVQRVYKKPLYELINQYILSPLKMQNTSFASSKPNEPLLANGHNDKGDAAPHLMQDYMQGSGGLRSSAADMIKYSAFLLDNKTPPTQLVLKQNISIDAGTNKVVGTYPADIVDDRVYSASLNWWHYNPQKGKQRIWADGGTPGFCSYVVLYRDAGVAVVVLSNKTGKDMFDALPNIANELLNAF